MMAKINLLELNVEKIFVEKSVEEIIEIDKLLDAEIERKRTELRSMVGDRYKDILTATDAIKCMETISESIIDDISSVKIRCETLVNNTSQEVPKAPLVIDKPSIEERIILVEIRLAFELNEFIWRALDDGEFSKAAQFYLLAQHIHTGLRLLRKDIFERYGVIKKFKETLDMLRERILTCTNDKLQTVELSTEDTCSNLNALMLLENHSSNQLLDKFIGLRKNALKTVIESTHASVRAQISAMVKCIYTTVHLLHDCFLNFNGSNKGLIWHQLDGIIKEAAPNTLSLLELPESNLLSYVPDIIRQFRPKCSNVDSNLSKVQTVEVIQKWLKDTSLKIEDGVKTALDLVPNIKGLHLIREEALRIEMPKNWVEICSNTELPKSFNVWNLFQSYVTKRAEVLVSKKVAESISFAQKEITKLLNNASMQEKSENDLRWYLWQEESGEQSMYNQKSLSMKTKGFSPNIFKQCQILDNKFLELLEDFSMYVYGVEYSKGNDPGLSFALRDARSNKKFVDREKLEMHLKQECSQNIQSLVSYLKATVDSNNEESQHVTKSIICARFLYGLTVLCENFNRCCTCNNSTEEWNRICIFLNKSSTEFWSNWIEHCLQQLEKKSSKIFSNFNTVKMMSVLCRWDTIEIQEQTDEKVFKSEIKVPMKSSAVLHDILDDLAEMLNSVLPHTLPKKVHLRYVEQSTLVILKQYENVAGAELSQMQALQFLFDVKYLTTFCIPRENLELVQKSQDVCDRLRSYVDPFDLDVFYKYLQHNVKQAALQTQVILGCLLPSSGQLSSLGVLEKNKDHEREPSILAVSTPATSNWFLLLPVTAPVQKTTLPTFTSPIENKVSKGKQEVMKKSSSAGGVRSGAAALFGAMTTEWFS